MLFFAFLAPGTKVDYHRLWRTRMLQLLDEDNYAKEMEEKVIPLLERTGRTEFVDGICREHYEIDSAKADVIVMHGYSEGLYKYRELFYHLICHGYNVHALEARGHGRSVATLKDDNKIHIENFDDYVSDLAKLADSIEGRRPKYLIGHSMGGCICLRYLETLKNEISKLVLSSPMARLDTHGIPEFPSLVISRNACRRGKAENFIFGQMEWLEKNDTFDRSAASSKCRYEYFRNFRTEHPQYRKSGASYAWIREALTAERKARKESGLIKIPTLLFEAEKDDYVDTRFFSHLKMDKLRIVRTTGTKHEVLNSDNSVLEKILDIMFSFLDNDECIDSN